MDIQTIEHYLNIDSSKYHEPSLEDSIIILNAICWPFLLKISMSKMACLFL